MTSGEMIAKAPEISLEEANDRLDKFKQEIERKRITPPKDGYGHFDALAIGTAGLSPLATMSSVGILKLSGILILPVEVALGAIALSFVHFATVGIMTVWNGNPRHRIRNFFAKYVFTSKKKRKLLKSRHKEWEAYHEALEIFRLYIADLYDKCDMESVLKVINKNEPEFELYMKSDGVFRIRELDMPKISEVNAEKVGFMMQELRESPRIKEKLLGEIEPFKQSEATQ